MRVDPVDKVMLGLSPQCVGRPSYGEDQGESGCQRRAVALVGLSAVLGHAHGSPVGELHYPLLQQVSSSSEAQQRL